MEQYNVTGMSCAACQAHVEKAVSKVPGVKSVAVSLLTNSMNVEGDAKPADVVKAVKDAGYGASLKGGQTAATKETASQRLQEEEESLEDHETPKMVRRLISSAGFLLVLMYFSMGHMMWHWPVPPLFENHVAVGVLEMLLAICVMIINRKFFINGFGAIRHGGTNMDTLVALGSSAAFGYSVVSLFIMIWYQGQGNAERVMYYGMNHMYFESAAMIPTLITVGKMLESMSKGKTTNALKSLMKLAPKEATILRDGKEVTVGIDEVQTGDIFVVKPGENIPVDGVIIEGSTAVNEAALTGESIPVDKTVDDAVSAATINQSGYIKCRATRVGEDTTLSQIIQMVSDAAATKAPLARIADKVSAVFVPSIIGISLITIVVWVLLGRNVGWSIARGISVLVVACPCALGLATPVAIMVGNGMGAKNGVLYKTAAALEGVGRTEVVALDKTGTITSGQPVVTDIIPEDGVTENELLSLANALEQKSEHPLARAIVSYGEEHNLKAEEVDDFSALPGNGLTAKLHGSELFGGNAKFISTKAEISDKLKSASEQLAEQGKTPLFFSKDGKLEGIIAVADTIKEDSPEAVRELKNMGIKVVMLTGDNERTARAIGKQAGVNQVIAGVLPDGKEAVVKALQSDGAKVAMVGDGINDAPALTRADTGIAIGAGADVAVDAADVVLVKSRLSDVPAAIRMGRATIRNIHENLFWAFFYNALCIPMAMGVYGIAMKPMYGAAAMACSSFFVCMNALRLNLVKMHDPKKDKKRISKHKNAQFDENGELVTLTVEDAVSQLEANAKAEGVEVKEDNNTKAETANGANCGIPLKTENAEEQNENAGSEAQPANVIPFNKKGLPTETVHIKGMMCGHCENRIQKAIGSLDGVDDVKADHEKGTAVVAFTKPVDEAAIKKAVEDNDYTFVSVDEPETGKGDDMTKTVTIKGMMCEHCEATVKKALEAIDGIDSATVSHDKGTAVIEESKEVPEAEIKKAIEDKDYTFVSIA